MACSQGDRLIGAQLDTVLPTFAGLDEESFVSALNRLVEQDLIDLPGTVFGGADNWHARLTARGENLVRELDDTRENPNKRRRVCEEAILYWLDQQSHAGQSTSKVGDFEKSSYGAVFGRPFDSDDVQFAGKWLADRSLIDIMGSFQLPVITMSLSPKGQDVVENDETLNDWLRGNRVDTSFGPQPTVDRETR